MPKMMAAVESIEIHIEYYGSRESLIRAAGSHYSNQRLNRERYDRAGGVKDDISLLFRITVTFLRNEAIKYERQLDETFGKVGAPKARLRMKHRVLEAISPKYPWRKAGCERQAGSP